MFQPQGDLLRRTPGKKLSKRPFVLVITSAVLFGISTPLAKLLTKEIPPIALAGLLYLGVFIGLTLHSLGRKIAAACFSRAQVRRVSSLGKKDLPWLAGAIIAGGVLGPICLMQGLARTSGFSASLLLNLEGIATALVAVVIFNERAPRRLWLALGFMTIAGICLSWNPGQNRFDLTGPLLILCAMLCWGLDNNFTRNISDKDPVQIAGIKGLLSGTISLAVYLIFGTNLPAALQVVYALFIGALCYGISLVLFIHALRGLGAFRTGAFFSIAPFVGALGSLFIFEESLGPTMITAAGCMVFGIWLILTEKHGHSHRHDRLTHLHSHVHSDPHHLHRHEDAHEGPHSHKHTHEEIDHVHGHWPDIHHRHNH